MILLDNNILIDYLRGVEAVESFISKEGKENLAINTVVAMELYQGCLNKIEFIKINKELNYFINLELNENIAQLALQLSKSYALSHQMSVSDAFIAATALIYDLELRTFNLKDFRFIPNLRVSNVLM